MTNPTVLPATPHDWSDDLGGYRQRWMPGAFGDLTTIEHVDRFRVLEDNWIEHDDGRIERTISRAKALPSPMPEHTP